jgi:hypothetical protein
MYGGVSQKSFPSVFSEVRFPLFRPPPVGPPNRSPRHPPSPVKELPKLTGGLRRLPTPRFRRRGPETTHEGYSVEYTVWQKFLGHGKDFWDTPPYISTFTLRLNLGSSLTRAAPPLLKARSLLLNLYFKLLTFCLIEFSPGFGLCYLLDSYALFYIWYLSRILSTQYTIPVLAC